MCTGIQIKNMIKQFLEAKFGFNKALRSIGSRDLSGGNRTCSICLIFSTEKSLVKSYLCAMSEKIIFLDFGSQYTQLIARRVRELNVYCEIHPFTNLPEFDHTVKGVIFSGSPYSVR